MERISKILVALSIALFPFVTVPAFAVDPPFKVEANIAADPDAPAVFEPIMTVELNGDLHLSRGVLVENATEDDLRPFDAQYVDCNDDTVFGNAPQEIYGPEYNREEFIVKFGNEVVARLDSLSGNLYIKGTCYQSQSTFYIDSNHSYFRVKDPAGQTLARIGSTGVLRLRGILHEDVDYRENFPTRMATFGDSVPLGVEALWFPIGGDFTDVPPDTSILDVGYWLPYLFSNLYSGMPQHAFSSGNAYADFVYSHAEYVDNLIAPPGFSDDLASANMNFAVSGATWNNELGLPDFAAQLALANGESTPVTNPFEYAVIYFGGNDLCQATKPIDCDYLDNVKKSLQDGIKYLRDYVSQDMVIVVVEIMDYVKLWEVVEPLAEAEPPDPWGSWCTLMWAGLNLTGAPDEFYCNSFLTNGITGDAKRAIARENIKQMNQVLENVCAKEKVYFRRGTYGIFAESGFHPNKMGIDCIHPAYLTHARLSDITWDYRVFKD